MVIGIIKWVPLAHYIKMINKSQYYLQKYINKTLVYVLKSCLILG